MALCEKYKMEILAERLVCPDLHSYCEFRTACLIYVFYEEWILKSREEEVEK